VKQDDTVKDLLRTAAQRWGFEYTQHSCYVPGGKEALPLTAIVWDLGVNALEVRGLDTTTPLSHLYNPGQMDFYSPMELCKEKTFYVTRLTSFSRRQERAIRIHRDYITKWKKDKSSGEKGPWKKMADLKEARVSNDVRKKSQFILDFDKVFTFEAASESEANEIVTKISKIKEIYY